MLRSKCIALAWLILLSGCSSDVNRTFSLDNKPPKVNTASTSISSNPSEAGPGNKPLLGVPALVEGRSRPNGGRCLALSGGGIRSALFATGVLVTLYTDDELQNFDVISSVSGGGYASAWLLTSLHRLSKSPAAPTREEFLSMANAELIPSVLQEYWAIGPVRLFGDTVNALQSLAIAPLGLLALYPTIESYAARAYRSRLERAFLGVGVLDSSLMAFSTTPSLERVRDTVVRRNLPNFVFNATVQGGNTDRASPPDLIFEFTPFDYGSNHTGFKKADQTFKIGDAIAISGAALDMPLASHVMGTVRSYSGLTLGRGIRPIRSDDDAAYYWLSDGGHIDNLGVMSLLKRECSTIYIVDAEEDRNYTFDGYRNLKMLARNYYSVDIHVPNIDVFLKEKHKPGTPFDDGAAVGWINSRGNAKDRRARIIYLKLAPTSLEAQGILDKDINQVLRDAIASDIEFPHYPTSNQYAISRLGIRGLIVLGGVYTRLGLFSEKNYEKLLGR